MSTEQLQKTEALIKRITWIGTQTRDATNEYIDAAMTDNEALQDAIREALHIYLDATLDAVDEVVWLTKGQSE